MTDTIYGMRAKPLVEGHTPLEAVAIVKTLDEEGDVSLSLKSTGGINTWEALGMTVAASATFIADLLEAWREDED